MGQVKFVASILFIAVFAIAVVTYVTTYAVENNANINIADDPNFTAINSSLQGQMVVFRGDINSSSAGFTPSVTEIASDTFKSPTIFENLRFSRDAINSILTLFKDKIFGGNPAFLIIISVISSYLVFLAVSYIWKTFKGGDPD